MTESYREVALSKIQDKYGLKTIDTALNESPILAAMPVQEANDNFRSVYDKVIDVNGFEQSDYDGRSNLINIDAKLAQEDLAIFKGRVEIGEESAIELGGFPTYMAKKAPIIAKQVNKTLEMWALYNRIKPFAFANKNVIDAKGSANKNTDILIVTFGEEENIGLYSKVGFSTLAPFKVSLSANGSLIENSKGDQVHQAFVSSYFGVQLANENKVSAITNIDLATIKYEDLASMLNEALLNARQSQGTMIFMSPYTKAILENNKQDKLTLVNADRDFNKTLSLWNGTPIITSFNMMTNLANAVVPA